DVVADRSIAEAGIGAPGVAPSQLAQCGVRNDRRTQCALVEAPQLVRARRPAEAPLRERPRGMPQAHPQLVVVEQALDGRRDLERVAAVQEDGLLAVPDESADVRR